MSVTSPRRRLAISPSTVVVAVLTVAGAALRLATAGQSLFGDELSTYFIVSTTGSAGTVATVHDELEITPPLSFVLSWLTTRTGVTHGGAAGAGPARRHGGDPAGRTRSARAPSGARRAWSPPRSPRSPRS